MNQGHEGSVEDILESIKKVIARDNGDARGEPRAAPRMRVPTPDAAPAAEAAGAGHDEPEADAVPLELTEPAPLDESNAAFSTHGEAEAAQVEDADEPPLVAPGSRMAMRESLAALAVVAEPRMPPQIVRSGETSLEALTRELLRPALAEWLDAHLPAMVEKLVAAEIGRIVGKKG